MRIQPLRSIRQSLTFKPFKPYILPLSPRHGCGVQKKIITIQTARAYPRFVTYIVGYEGAFQISLRVFHACQRCSLSISDR